MYYHLSAIFIVICMLSLSARGWVGFLISIFCHLFLLFSIYLLVHLCLAICMLFIHIFIHVYFYAVDI